jgi:hypothetical protein
MAEDCAVPLDDPAGYQTCETLAVPLTDGAAFYSPVIETAGDSVATGAASSRAIVIDMGGPGRPFDRAQMVEWFRPLLSEANVIVYREPWTIEPPSDRCLGAVGQYARELLQLGLATNVTWSSECVGIQLSSTQYRQGVTSLVDALRDVYSVVSVVGFSFGATRLAPAIRSLHGIDITFVEPGPQPGTSVGEWARVRLDAASDVAEAQCSSLTAGASNACAAVRAARSDDVAERFVGELATLRVAALPNEEPVALEHLAARSLYLTNTGDMTAPGAAFLMGLCQLRVNPGEDPDGGSAYERLGQGCELVEETGDWAVGALPVCMLANGDDPVFGVMAEQWELPANSSFHSVQGQGQAHGAVMMELVSGRLGDMCSFYRPWPR